MLALLSRETLKLGKLSFGNQVLFLKKLCQYAEEWSVDRSDSHGRTGV